MRPRGMLNPFGHLTDHFGVCLDSIAIDLQMTVLGLDWHLWGSLVTKLVH